MADHLEDQLCCFSEMLKLAPCNDDDDDDDGSSSKR